MWHPRGILVLLWPSQASRCCVRPHGIHAVVMYELIAALPATLWPYDLIGGGGKMKNVTCYMLSMWQFIQQLIAYDIVKLEYSCAM